MEAPSIADGMANGRSCIAYWSAKSSLNFGPSDNSGGPCLWCGIVAFNTAEGLSRDVTDDIANELRKRCADGREIPSSLREFLDGHGS